MAEIELQSGNSRKILGLNFFFGSAAEALSRISNGGLLVAPAAPALNNLSSDARYRAALISADLVITDSALMVLFWNFMHLDHVRRLSGLEYLAGIIRRPEIREPGGSFWIMAGEASARTNAAWLNQNGVALREEHAYIAPFYKSDVVDPELIAKLEALRPKHIVITLGGGTQECLGAYLKRNLSYSPAIHCIGAAIAFLSGDQVHIPLWADRFFLGWLFRCASDPGRYGPRYWGARKLIPLMLRYQDSLPDPVN